LKPALSEAKWIIRAFVELREKVAANALIRKRLAEIDKAAFRQKFATADTVANTRDGCAPRRKNATVVDRRYSRMEGRGLLGPIICETTPTFAIPLR